MDVSTGRAGGEQPLERFKPTSGQLVGWCGVAVAVLVIGWVAVAEHTVTGLRLGLGAAFGAVLVWVTQLRPRVTAYAESLVLHGTVSDLVIHYLAVEEVSMGQTLNVWAAGRRYVCIGIGKPVGFDTRQRLRGQRSGGLLGANRVEEFHGSADGGSRQAGVVYQSFVLDRIKDLVAAGQQHRVSPDERPRVRRVYAVPELVALTGTGLAFLAALLL